MKGNKENTHMNAQTFCSNLPESQDLDRLQLQDSLVQEFFQLQQKYRVKVGRSHIVTFGP